MGLIYSVSVFGSGVAAALDVFALLAPSDASVILHEVKLLQSSDFGDAQSEILRVQLATYTGSNGSGGSTPTPVALTSGSVAAASTVHALDTTQAATATVIREDAWNVQVGWHYLPLPEHRIVLKGGLKLVVALPAAPADAIDLVASMIFEEVGS